jgi:hypothetical protein
MKCLGGAIDNLAVDGVSADLLPDVEKFTRATGLHRYR